MLSLPLGSFSRYFMLSLSSADFFKINFLEKFFQELNKSVKQFGSRSGQPECRV